MITAKMGQKGKERLTLSRSGGRFSRARTALSLVVLVVICAVLPAAFAGGAMAQSVVARQLSYMPDPLTGVALGGYDPVSYFTGDAPRLGTPEFEYYWKGVSWYFASEANLEVFKRQPELYAPQFGGFGTMAMARGFVSGGDPTIYVVLDDELFLFHSMGNKIAFEQIRHTARLRARENWAEIQPTLVPR